MPPLPMYPGIAGRAEVLSKVNPSKTWLNLFSKWQADIGLFCEKARTSGRTSAQSSPLFPLWLKGFWCGQRNWCETHGDLFQVHRSFCLPRPRGDLRSPHFRHSVPGLDLVAAVLTVNSTDRRFRFWHRRVHRDLALRLELSFHVSDQSSILLRTQPLLLVEQVILKAHDWIAFPPVLHHFRRQHRDYLYFPSSAEDLKNVRSHE